MQTTLMQSGSYVTIAAMLAVVFAACGEAAAPDMEQSPAVTEPGSGVATLQLAGPLDSVLAPWKEEQVGTATLERSPFSPVFESGVIDIVTRRPMPVLRSVDLVLNCGCRYEVRRYELTAQIPLSEGAFSRLSSDGVRGNVYDFLPVSGFVEIQAIGPKGARGIVDGMYVGGVLGDSTSAPITVHVRSTFDAVLR